MSRDRDSAFSLERFACWASGLDPGVAHKCVSALATSLAFPPQNRTAYGHGFFDAVSLSPPDFPLFRDADELAPFLRWYTKTSEDKIDDTIQLIKCTQNRKDKHNYADCFVSITPVLAGFPVDVFYGKEVPRKENMYYKVDTICPITGETETGIFQQRRQKIQWCYTYDQLHKELKRRGLTSFVPPFTEGVYASTHFQDGIGNLRASVTHVDIVGMYTPDIEPYVVQFKSTGKSHIDYACALLEGGPELNRSVLQNLLSVGSLRVGSIYPRERGTCDFCRSKRKLTTTLKIGAKAYRAGTFCAKKIRLAHKFLHHEKLGLSLTKLTDEFAVVIQK